MLILCCWWFAAFLGSERKPERKITRNEPVTNNKQSKTRTLIKTELRDLCISRAHISVFVRVCVCVCVCLSV